jgi:zinc protease
VLEDADQQGLAHFMEHMNFNGTTHFPKNDLVDYLQKSGVRFGADLNAYTSFDETVYQLPIPTDNPEILKNGFQIMRDWAQSATLDSIEINKERGVVLEEERLGRGASERMERIYFPVLLNQSRYSERLPIGKVDILNNFPPSAIRRFHYDWYRPDLQALVVVGDIDPLQTEKIVRSLFSDLKAPISEKARTRYSAPLTGMNQFLIVTDKEMPQTELQVLIKHREEKLVTEQNYIHAMQRQLFNKMLAGRFSELAQTPNLPFIDA